MYISSMSSCSFSTSFSSLRMSSYFLRRFRLHPNIITRITGIKPSSESDGPSLSCTLQAEFRSFTIVLSPSRYFFEHSCLHAGSIMTVKKVTCFKVISILFWLFIFPCAKNPCNQRLLPQFFYTNGFVEYSKRAGFEWFSLNGRRFIRWSVWLGSHYRRYFYLRGMTSYSFPPFALWVRCFRRGWKWDGL